MSKIHANIVDGEYLIHKKCMHLILEVPDTVEPISDSLHLKLEMRPQPCYMCGKPVTTLRCEHGQSFKDPSGCFYCYGLQENQIRWQYEKEQRALENPRCAAYIVRLMDDEEESA